MKTFKEYTRDYKAEYKKHQSSQERIKYRAELVKYNRDKGTYGNGYGQDASHKDGKIVGFEGQSKNRGRAEASRLKGSKRKVEETVGKFMTGEVGIKGKRVKVEVEVSGVDNKKRIYHAKVLAPKEHFGLELQIPAKVMHRGKWIKTKTGKAFEEAKQSQALVVGGKIAARGSKRELMKKVKKDKIKLDPRGDQNFLTYTGKEVGDSW